MNVKIVTTPAEKLAVYRFRYSVIVDELGVLIPAADHDQQTVQDPEDDSGHLFAAFNEEKVVGTGRVNFLRDGIVSPHWELLNLSAHPSRDILSVTTRFLVDAEHRGSLVAVRLIQAWYRLLRNSGIEFDYILTKHDLLDMYTRIGYLPYGNAVSHPEVGEVLPLRLDILDGSHLINIRSPLVRCLYEVRQSPNSAMSQNSGAGAS